MRIRRIFAAFCIASSAYAFDLDESIDRMDDALRVTAFDDNLRARFSGLLDLEVYHFSDAPSGLIQTSSHSLFNPRLTMFVDAQLGAHVYGFAQGRIDRGFDPSDNGVRGRLDEYALRVTPFREGELNIQVGKFATVAGNWVERHLSWDNPFISAPLPYEYTTNISDIVPSSSSYFYSYNYYYPPAANLKYEYLPLIWGPSYATGASISGRLGKFDYAIEMKNTSLSSRPEVWRLTKTSFSNPTVTGHVAFRPNEMWKFGVTTSEGTYLQDEIEHDLPSRHGVGDYHQILLGQDISFAWHHFQLWAEVYEVRFQLPRVGNADTLSYYLEAKYKITPQLFAAVRWNQQFFGTVPDGYGNRVHWDDDISRVEAAIGYRLTRHTQVKFEYGISRITGSSEDNHTLAGQFTVRF
jgi:hypothetical protein